MQKTIYIAGKITGDKHYKEKFHGVQKTLEAKGYIVMSPAILPEGFSWEAYIPICYAMIDACEEVIFLPDWIDSKGAQMEMDYAKGEGKIIRYWEV